MAFSFRKTATAVKKRDIEKGTVFLVLMDIHSKIMTANHAYLAHIKLIGDQTFVTKILN